MVWEYYEPPALSPSSRLQSLDLEVQSILVGVKPLLLSAPVASPGATAAPAFTTKEAAFAGAAAWDATLSTPVVDPTAVAEAAAAPAASVNASSLLRDGTTTEDLANVDPLLVGGAGCVCGGSASSCCASCAPVLPAPLVPHTVGARPAHLAQLWGWHGCPARPPLCCAVQPQAGRGTATATASAHCCSPGCGLPPLSLAQVEDALQQAVAEGAGQSLACQPDAACEPQWAQEAAAVVLVVGITEKSGFYCTGARACASPGSYGSYPGLMQ